MIFPKITHGKPAIVLAPMEGVTDAPMRALLTERGGFTYCVSEFLRINHELLPPRVYLHHVPELKNRALTPSGVPVQIQLLGGNEERMAQSALRAVKAGAFAIDINFGCPAPTVNRHDGGAAILRYPERVFGIVKAVRSLVPREIPVSAKLRLGWENMEDIFVNAEKAALGGADWITIHARTKVQGYIPPAHWSYIAQVKKNLDIPVVANGEIWTREDFLKCQEITQCEHFMIGRGALSDPALPHEMGRLLGILPTSGRRDAYPFASEAQAWIPLLRRFVELNREPHLRTKGTRQTLSRIKQWLRYVHLKKNISWFDSVKRLQTLEELFEFLEKN